MLLNAANIPSDKTRQPEREESSYAFTGGALGFCFYWLAFVIPFFVYGLNTPFFLLYTWPFFLALMPVSVLIGIAVHRLISGRLWLSVILTGSLVVLLFWQVFLMLTGW